MHSAVAEAVYNRCVKDNGLHVEDENYSITFYYEFLEDVYVDWSDDGDGAASETSSQISFSMEEVAEDEEFRKIQGAAAMTEAVTQLEKKDNHPLMIMVKQLRQEGRQPGRERGRERKRQGRMEGGRRNSQGERKSFILVVIFLLSAV